MSKPIFIVLGLAVLTAAGCAPQRPEAVNTAVILPENLARRQAASDSLAFAQTLGAFGSLPPETVARRRTEAEDLASFWRDFEKIAAQRRNRRDLPAMYSSAPPDRRGLHVGLAQSLRDLEQAVERDPGFAEAWAGLGHLRLEIGDLQQGLPCLENALTAAGALAAAGSPPPHDLLLQIHRDRCWALRDLALWERGLAAVRQGLVFHPGDPDLLLIKGLLLAGAGRYSEATSLAVRLPAFDIRRYGDSSGRSGLELIPSDYAGRWIRSQALMAEGDLQGALWVLGKKDADQENGPAGADLLKNRLQSTSMEHHRRFWNDVGLAAELVDDPAVAEYYFETFRMRDYSGYYPASVHFLGPLVLGVPDAGAPCFLSFGSGFFLGGSPFAFAAAQMDIMSLALFPERRQAAAKQALAVLDIMERRRIRPDICRALRGRIHYRLEEYADARRNLEAAHAGFAAQDLVDPRTSLLLGVLALDRENFAAAGPFLEEAVAADSTVAVAWRSLGVALASLDRQDEALACMDRALQLEPHSLVGYFNRGLLNMQLQRYPEAVADLDRAWRLDPENQDTRRLLQTAAAALRSRGEDPAEHAALLQTEQAQRPLPPGTTLEIPSDLLLEHLWRDLEGFMEPAETGARDREKLLADREGWESQYRSNPEPHLRKILALAYLDLGKPDRTLSLLAPGWGKDLEPDEEIFLLYAERRMGAHERARSLARGILTGDLTVGNPYVAALAAREAADQPDGLPADAAGAIIGRWIDLNAQTSSHSLRQWQEILARGIRQIREVLAAPQADRAP